MRQADAAEGQNHFGRQLLVALEAAVGHRVAHRLLDLTLRGDADFLEKSAQAGVEDVFVHEGPLEVTGGPDGLACIRRDRAVCDRRGRRRWRAGRRDPCGRRYIPTSRARYFWRGRSCRRQRWCRPWLADPVRDSLQAAALAGKARSRVARSYVACSV